MQCILRRRNHVHVHVHVRCVCRLQQPCMHAHANVERIVYIGITAVTRPLAFFGSTIPLLGLG